jgi:hypothetical protein
MLFFLWSKNHRKFEMIIDSRVVMLRETSGLFQYFVSVPANLENVT